jgi:hypothetical protein
MLFPDLVKITPIVRDATYRTETEGSPFNSKAYVEDESKIRYGPDGQPLDPDIFVGLPKDTSINEGDRVNIIKLHGQIITADGIGNPIGLWRCDAGKGNGVMDSSGFNNHGGFAGNLPAWVTGISKYAVYVPGTNERVICGNGDPLDKFGIGDFSISMWIKKVDFVESYGRIISKTIPRGFRLSSYQSRDQLYFVLNDGVNGASTQFTNGAGGLDGNWNHIVIVIDRTTDKVYLYLNKVKDAIEGDISAVGDADNTADLAFGAVDSGSSPYRGSFDEIRFYNKALSQSEVDFLYDNPNGIGINSLIGGTRNVKKVTYPGATKTSHIEVLI